MSVIVDRRMGVIAANVLRAVSPTTTQGAALLTLALVGAAYALEHHIGLDLGDEGFLWYGAWRTLLGEVPIRDFQSYDPGRYYWAALWFQLFGNDIFVLRLSSAVIHAAGLASSLALLRRVTYNPWFLSAAAVVIACWLFPRHKPFEPVIAILGLHVATIVIETPSAPRVFLAGTFVGAAAFVGRNHGVYLAVAFLALLIWLRLRHGTHAFVRDAVMFGAGIVVGYSPMLAMLAFVHGFGQAFVGSFSAYLRDQSLPLFWTWTELSNRASFVISVKLVALGCLHILAPAMCAYLFVCLVRDARSGASTPPVVAGAAFVGTIYLHYVFSRADIRHFAQGVAPLLVGWAALAAALRGGPRRRCVATVAGCFVLLTCVSVLLERPVARYWMDRKHYRTVAVGNRELIVPPMVEGIVSVTIALGSRFPAGDGVLIVPNWPALYVLLDRRAPIRETYTLFREGKERQQEIIRELARKDIRWVIVNDLRDDRNWAQHSFEATHELVWRHILAHYAPQPLPLAPTSYLLFRAPEAAGLM